MPDERNIEKDFRFITTWLAAHRDMKELADMLQYWIPIVQDSKSEFARIKQIKDDLEQKAGEVQGRLDGLVNETLKAEANKQTKLDEIERACDAQQKESESKIKPTQDALVSLQGQVLTTKKELDDLQQQKQEKLAVLDNEIRQKETRNREVDSEFAAIQRKHFGT